MKIFLSALENQRDAKCNGGKQIAQLLIDKNVKMLWNLMSYYYARKVPDLAVLIRDNSENIMIDSGAHSFQKGTKVDWVKYTYEYAEFIQKFDRPNVIGYFEMDVDNIIGYEKVLQLRAILENVSGKIIPVWHKNRGIEDFKQMCEKYSGKVVAITGWRNEDIKDDQYKMFVKYAHDHNCRIHCLGMTRRPVLEKVPFDYTDSSSWVQDTLYGRVGKKKVTRDMSSKRRGEAACLNYLHGMEMQRYYHKKWLSVNRD